mgnify:FL=1
MKKITYIFALFLFISCANESNSNLEISEANTIESSNETKDKNETYQRNSSNLKTLFDHWEAKDVEASVSLLSEDFVETGTSFNENDRNRSEWKENVEGMMSVMSPSLKNAIYLPGIDTVNFQPDGSVRYYGTWNFSVGDKNEDLKVYGTANFNDEGLITTLAHYADFGLTMMQIMPEEMMQQMMGYGE